MKLACEATSASNSYMIVPSYTAQSASAFDVYLVAVTVSGINQTCSTADPFSLTFSNSNQLVGYTLLRNTYLYTAAFFPIYTGIYTLNATLNGAIITPSPVSITVTPGAIDPNQCVVSAIPIATVNIPFDLSVTKKDASGNLVTTTGNNLTFVVISKKK